MSLAPAPLPADIARDHAARYATLIVHAGPGLQATQRVEVAGRLARELDAHLVGVCAEALSPFAPSDPNATYSPDERIVRVVERLQEDLADAEAAFRRDAAGADLSCFRVEAFPAQALSAAARGADLILVSPQADEPDTREANPGDVVMQSGKPVLVVPPHAHRLRWDTVVVAWKDTPETRRAIAAAMPFLLEAEEVVVVSVCDEGHADRVTAQVDEVVAGLRRHGVKARARVKVSHDGVFNELMRTVSGVDADLIVAGAYGHSRIREFVFGGVTEHFLRRPACFVLLAH